MFSIYVKINIALKTELDLMNQDLNVFSKEIYEISKKEFSIIKFEEKQLQIFF